ncbi:MAG: hypothetical protein UR69_C0001G0050 [Candidatus Moranbacteria bacterium GW2011_GWE2_35_2-]|nr:MAG: hypothetical protein UR69_C0001G0050 [Candidatus Moranbacteria bacterium GW2011_GWE2_35_2-]KKQ22952.1 MAG: hypothetical protein US37_C0001G0224 [Candidatus Moranbacteria bacterium GW2011_GWF2_37_11]KKQ29310.1 MAG: hypothetical protein US44_C0002G0092 [Candidatus Moranbacteria bacterium GW2011_GWD1_37_17]KKQ30817.1 MAG: hypothetical protein US47_C0001G0050 [Candidatus Moranbacteria bacterium GW2011_GWE1_37_24]KKQ47980.1 MAG: hypothetical protein US66_C0003G0034 [Candidatus Moranbacteria 
MQIKKQASRRGGMPVCNCAYHFSIIDRIDSAGKKAQRIPMGIPVGWDTLVAGEIWRISSTQSLLTNLRPVESQSKKSSPFPKIVQLFSVIINNKTIGPEIVISLPLFLFFEKVLRFI